MNEQNRANERLTDVETRLTRGRKSTCEYQREVGPTFWYR